MLGYDFHANALWCNHMDELYDKTRNFWPFIWKSFNEHQGLQIFFYNFF